MHQFSSNKELLIPIPVLGLQSFVSVLFKLPYQDDLCI